MGSLPKDGKPIQINGPIQIHASICKFVVTSAAEAELGALFYNIQEGTILRLALEELGPLNHPPRSTATTSPQSELQMTQSKNNDHGPWKCVSFALLTKSPSETSMSHGILARKTSPTTSQNTSKQDTTKRYALGISTCTTRREYCREHWRPAR